MDLEHIKRASNSNKMPFLRSRLAKLSKLKNIVSIVSKSVKKLTSSFYALSMHRINHNN